MYTVFTEMASRKYEQRERAARQAETCRRIAAATSELHEEVGPARTTVAEVARRAGVQRLTVYNNFPEDYDLIVACQGHWLEAHPPPDPSRAFELEDPAEALRAALASFYGWYRSTQRMAENVRRDRGTVEALDRRMRETTDVALAGLARALAARFSSSGRPRKAVLAAVALALDFWTWRRLSDEGLSDKAAADLMTALATVAAAGR
jgi:AcrR family transcriptional regulator